MEFAKILPLIEDQARRMLMARLNVHDFCPACGAPLSPRVLPGWHAGKQILCKPCGFHGNWRYGTVIKGSHAQCAEILLIDFAEKVGADRRKVAASLGYSLSTIQNIAEKLASENAAQSGASDRKP